MSGSVKETAPRRAELLDVATTLFYEKGYAHTTLQDIADRMGFTKPAIYYYAKNKEELLVEIYTSIVAPAISSARATARAPATDGATQFTALIRQHLETFLNNIEANAVFEVQLVSLSEASRNRIQALARDYTTILRRVYDRGMSDGSIRSGHSAIAVNAVIGMCNSAHRWYKPGGKVKVEQVADELLAIVDSGIRSRGA